MMEKYLDFVETSDLLKRKTKTFRVYNVKTGDFLGMIKWNNGWRQYCFYPDEETVWSKGCLEEINDTIKHLMTLRINKQTRDALLGAKE